MCRKSTRITFTNCIALVHILERNATESPNICHWIYFQSPYKWHDCKIFFLWSRILAYTQMHRARINEKQLGNEYKTQCTQVYYCHLLFRFYFYNWRIQWPHFCVACWCGKVKWHLFNFFSFSSEHCLSHT